VADIFISYAREFGQRKKIIARHRAAILAARAGSLSALLLTQASP
jgi:hypothetical protein